MNKVVIGMSGGVDSSVAALLLMRQGYEVMGVTMHTWGDLAASEAEAGSAVQDAERVAESLGIPHRIVDFRKEFSAKVQDYFVREYLEGRTPNPCVVCNRYVKWEALLAAAREMGADYIATGHYARIIQLDNGRYSIRNSVTAAKDQTYALYGLSQDQLAHTLMPIGAYPKEEIRKIALEAGLPVAHKADSQDICFIPDHDYAGFVKSYSGVVPRPGNFVDRQGNVIGCHNGIIHYTVGQRKGLGNTFGRPMFVLGINPESNEVILGESSEVFSSHLICDQLNFMTVESLEGEKRVRAKIRYSHKGADCIIRRIGEDRVECIFDEPVRAVTPGQAVVFYDGELVMGGGRIISG